jgi:hypothetical protein
MAVISITLVQSSTQRVPGIPDTITVSTNIPAMVFYTLNGEDPNTNSNIYTTPIQLPGYAPNLILKLMATNGTDNSGVIEQIFTIDLASIENFYSGSARFPQAVSNNGSYSQSAGNSLEPFGSGNGNENIIYTGVGNPDNTLFNEGIATEIPHGFDQVGNPTSFTNFPLDPFGDPPEPEGKNVRIVGKNGPRGTTDELTGLEGKIFNPRALVVYHDTNDLDPLMPVLINRPHFSLQNSETVKDGLLLNSNNLGTASTTGSYVKSYYNPNTGKMTTYYRDNSVNRWIISTWDYAPTNNSGNLANMVFSRGRGANHVYSWHLWFHRTLM